MPAITGMEKTSLSDYPGKIAIIGFVGKTAHDDVGCNMRCPFCHNKELWHEFSEGAEDIEEAFLKRVHQTRGFVDAVVISGGEPTLLGADKLLELSNAIRKINPKFSLKLDTNGLKPDVLSFLIDQKAFDYYAMDIKGAIATYSVRTGLLQDEFDINAIRKSIDLIVGSGVDYEFRTTVIPSFNSSGIDEKKMKAEIESMISDFDLLSKITPNGNLVLQNYIPVPSYFENGLSSKDFKNLVHSLIPEFPFVVSRDEYSSRFVARKKNDYPKDF